MSDVSRAMPIRFYRDPADVVELNQLDDLGCHACDSSWSMNGRLACLDDRNPRQKGVPRVGHHCRFFKVKESK